MSTYHLTGPVLAGADVEYADVWVRDGRLTFDPGGQGAEIRGWVLPGLVDMHCHIGLGIEGPVDRETARDQADQDLRAGTLLVRDAGSPSDTRWLDQEIAPQIIRAGRHIARPKRYLRYYARELDAVGDLPQAMAEEAVRGDGWVKLVGDWIDRSRGPAADLEPLWPADQLAAGVRAAHENGARVAVHTFATETLDDLFDVGVDCIEHGTGMTAGHMERAAAAGVAVVPTMLQVANFDRIATQGELRYPRFAARMRAMYARREQHVRELYEAGVPLYLGTDAGGTIGHGRLADEAAALVQAGLPAPDVVAAASWQGRDFLGRPGIAEGAPADVVVFAEDPRADITALSRPSAVIRAGYRIA